MKRISILLADLRGGGAERVNLDLAYEFCRAGHDVQIVLMRGEGVLLPEAQENLSVVNLNCTRARFLLFALIKYLRSRRPDALLAAMWPLTVIAPIAQRLSGHRCKVLVSEHGMISSQYSAWGWRHKLLMRLSIIIGYRLADYRVAVSKGVAVDMAKLSGICKEAFDVIYNPVPKRSDPEPTEIDVANNLWSCSSGARILTVGAMKAVKNQALLIRAFARLDREDARLMILGSGKERESLLLLAQELNVADRIVFAGFHADPTPFYQTADLFVLSSNYEGFGNVLVEAMASGLSVVSTDCPSGPREILDGGKYGSLVPVGNECALAIAIKAALNEPYDSNELRWRATDFEPEIAARAYEQLFLAKSDIRQRVG